MARKVDVSLIKELNAGAEGQKVEKIAVTRAGVILRYMSNDKAMEFLLNYGNDRIGD